MTKLSNAEIITLRAIALKLFRAAPAAAAQAAEIITLRAIALKHAWRFSNLIVNSGRDHNATSYSTETRSDQLSQALSKQQRS